jgi:hypothetical protein
MPAHAGTLIITALNNASAALAVKLLQGSVHQTLHRPGALATTSSNGVPVII